MQSILFIELLGGIGDLLIALSAIQSVARSNPHARLTVLTFAPGDQLLQHDPLIHEVVVARGASARDAVERLLHERQFDLIITTTTYEGIGELAAQHATVKAVTNLWRRPPPDEFVGERFARLLVEEGVVDHQQVRPAEIRLLDAERGAARDRLQHLARPLVVFIGDTGMPIKRWPAARFAQLGRELVARGASVLVPAAGDGEGAAALVGAVGRGAHLWPRGTLRELAAFLAEARLVVAVDTGPARIAAALSVPVITLFGPAWHGRYGQSAPNVNLQGVADCPDRNVADFTTQACWYSGRCTQGWPAGCLEEIRVSDVLPRALPFLQSNEATGGEGCTSA